jgi:glycosyltransferase involved in cell wall biosynthesis
MGSEPMLSVVIPAHNSAATLARALASVLAQTRRPEEVIVVDDQSTDNIREVLASYPQGSIKLISTKVRKGAGGARNEGVAGAAGDVIAFLDADDEWLPNKLEKQLVLLLADPRLSFVTCGANSISPGGTDLGDTYGAHRIAAGSEAWKQLLACNFIVTPSVIVWRRHLLTLGGFNEKMKIGEDQDMWIRLALAGSLGYVPESLVRVHLSADSLSSWALSDLLTYTLPMIERHVAEQRHQLTGREVCRILGERLNRFGRVAYVRGDLASGLRLIARSILLGYRPAESAFYLLNAAPPLTWFKRQFRPGAAA